MRPEEISLRMRGVAGLGAALASRMIRQLAAAGGQPRRLLRELGLNDRQRAQFLQADPQYLAATLRWLEQTGCRMLSYGEAGYPERLSHIDDAPLWLLVQGNPQALLQPQIAMVGSRRFSHYGERWARYFAGELTHCGFTVTSGLAIGIDGICHRAALEAEGCTVAVLGSGLANVYPRRHRRLAEQIVDQGGAVISEHLVTDLPLADHFPRRNRIISGLSLGVLVLRPRCAAAP